MRLKFPVGVLFSCALFFASNAFAWNGTGHEIVADIAWDNLTPEAKAKVTALLQQHPDYTRALMKPTTPAGDERDREAFMVAATWPDLIRSASFGKSHLLNRPNWHYIDIPYVIGDVKSPENPSMKWTVGKEPENAIQAILKNSADLRNAALSPADRAVALCWIEHLIGDIHQPLHAVSLYSSQFPDGDRGGNSLIVRTDGPDGRTQNLHSLWDGMLGGFLEIDAVEKIADKLEKEHPRKEFEKELAVTDIDHWVYASQDEAKHVVYMEGKVPGVPRSDGDRNGTQPAVPPLPQEYMDRAHALADRKVTLAGYRLADALNNIFVANP
ncbi:MAG TPA: S1/P1 nuclease [Phycisphaerae bacterium]|nr:S1/P1 nuclease [Phycisphaerae bacterium]